MKKIALLFIMIFTIVYFGCKKDKADNSTQSAKDYALAENIFSDVFKQVDDAAKSEDDSLFNSKSKSQQLSQAGGCATVSISPFDTITWPKTLVVDFGVTNCLCIDNKYRRGKILANFTGRYRDSTTVITITFDNYYVNDNKVEGTKIVTNNGHNSNGNLSFSINVINAKIINSSGTILWNSTRTREWIAGESTKWPNIWDDVYLISGSANGSNINGVSFTVDITSSLRVEIGCRWIVEGKLELKSQGIATRFVDYGNGSCDNQASVTVNGNVYNITLQ
ncbi:MAG: hypothetical protein K9J13_15140 [Saprospiraceae bacterium]|nr:hypothetical protein [Saprospiraceae bacterium]